MKISLFDLAAVVSEYNYLSDNCHSLDYDFGFACLQPTLRNKIKEHVGCLYLSGSEERIDSGRLYSVTQEHLEPIMQYYHTAKKECKNNANTLPKTVQQRFEVYLTVMEREIQAAQAFLVERMLEKLEEISLFQNQAEKMDQAQFSYFLQYVLRYGSSIPNFRCHQLLWMKDHASYVKVQKPHGVTFIPKQFVDQSLVPNSVLFAFLFQGAYFRSTFFDDKSWLFVRLHRLSHLQLVEREVCYATWKNILLECDEVEKELCRCDYQCSVWQPKGLWQYIWRSLKKFVENWQHFSAAQHDLIELRKVESIARYAEYMTAAIEKSPIFETLSCVDELADVIQEAKLMVGIMSNDERRMALNTSVRTLTELLKKVTARQEKIQFQDRSTEELNGNALKAEGLLMAVCSVDLLVLDDRQFGQLATRVKFAVDSLQRSENIQHRALADDVIAQIFCRYVQACITVSQRDVATLYQNRLEKIAILLLSIAGETLGSRINALCALEKKGRSRQVYLAKCNSFLQSYGARKGDAGHTMSERQSPASQEIVSTYFSQRR